MAFPTPRSLFSEIDEILSQDDTEGAESPPGETTGALARRGTHDNYSELSQESDEVDDTGYTCLEDPRCTEECRSRIRRLTRQMNRLHGDLATLREAHRDWITRIYQLTAEKADLTRENEKLKRQCLAIRNGGRHHRKVCQKRVRLVMASTNNIPPVLVGLI